MGSRKANLVDAHIGNRIRICRTWRGLTQEELGKELGISYQQLQKYETGQNRVSAARLYDIAVILKVLVNFFYEGLESTEEETPDVTIYNTDELAWLELFREMTAKERQLALELLRSLINKGYEDVTD